MTLTEAQAYRKGQRSRAGSADWDDALWRFIARWCPHSTEAAMCPLCNAWCDGFSAGPGMSREVWLKG